MGLFANSKQAHQDGWVDITPEIAKQMLQTNYLGQREIKMSVVHQYAQDMKAGLWQSNGEPIQFDSNGMLRNGQHRLRAIIESGVTVRLYVIYNIDSTIFDVGYRRNPKDQLRMGGVDIPITASSAAKIIVGKFAPVGSGSLNEYCSAHKEDIERAYKACCVGTNGRSSKRSACVAATYLMLRTKKAQYYEMEMYWQVFNTKQPRLAGDREASSILVARDMYDSMPGVYPRRNELEIYILSMEDFLSNKPREQDYRIEVPYHWEPYMDQVRSEDGL